MYVITLSHILLINIKKSISKTCIL